MNWWPDMSEQGSFIRLGQFRVKIWKGKKPTEMEHRERSF